MNKVPTRLRRDTEAALLQLAERFQLMTADAAWELRRDLFNSPADANNVLIQLATIGLLREITLYGFVSCFVPADRNKEKPFSETTKIRALAMLQVCASRSASRRRLTASEFTRYFPELRRPGLPMNYYIDLSQDQPKLGFLRIDMGGRGRWDRIVAKALDDMRKHRLEPAFARFIKRDALEIRIVTALQQKANRIYRVLKDKPTSLAGSIQVSVVSELLSLIAPISA